MVHLVENIRKVFVRQDNPISIVNCQNRDHWLEIKTRSQVAYPFYKGPVAIAERSFDLILVHFRGVK